MFLLSLLIILLIFLLLARNQPQQRYWRPKGIAPLLEAEMLNLAKGLPFRKKKPDWVRKEVIRLIALMPNNGCRKVSHVFNRLHKAKQSETVSKSYVYNIIKAHQYEIQVIRRRIKHKLPKSLPNNIVWSLDLTTVNDQLEKNTVLGIIDNGSRACLLLRKIHNKSSISLLHCLLDTIELYGKPRSVRTDNEIVFTSSLFRGLLWILGIKHQRTEIACPWQNGRIERFFGSFKAAIRKITVKPDSLQLKLREFRVYYNHIRPHQHLNGSTPAEKWNKTKPNREGKAIFCNAWKGALAGFYLPPE